MTDRLLTLIDRIYAAALDQRLWSGVMNDLADLLGGVEATLHVNDASSGQRLLVAPRSDPDYLASYRQHWVHANPLMQASKATPVGLPTSFGSVVSRDDFERTAFFNEWWAPQGLGTGGMGATLMAGRDGWSGCAVHPGRNRSLKTNAQTLFAALSPHLVRALEIQRRLERAAVRDRPHEDEGQAATRLRKRFGLTPAEAALALEICKGDGRQAAARRCGITVATAHTHLNRIFSKTGARRQAELVRLLLSDEGAGAVPVRLD